LAFQSLWNIDVAVGVEILASLVLMCDLADSVIRERVLDEFSSVTDTERTPLVARCLSERQYSFYPQDLYVFSDPDFSAVIQESEIAILNGVYPRRNGKGSSGNYFVTNLAGVCCISLTHEYAHSTP